MATQVDGNVKSFTAGAALNPFLRVKLSSGTVVVAGAGEEYIGVTQQEAASGAQVSVKLRSGSGTVKVTAAGAFSAGADLYGAAGGKVDDTVSGSIQFMALDAATAADDIVEVLPV